MTKNSKSAWTTNYDDELYVSASLGTLLRLSRVLGAAPARLRRVRGSWALSVSPSIAKLQRLIVAISSTTLTVLMVLLTRERSKKNAGHQDLILSEILESCEMGFIMLLYTYCVWTTLGRLTLSISALRQMQKIKTSLFCQPSAMKCERLTISVKLLYFYIIWQTLSCAEDLVWTYKISKFYNVPETSMLLYQCLDAGVYYQYLMVQLIQLQWSITMLELTSTLSLINDQLEQLLLTPSTSSKDMKIKLYLKELVPHNLKISTQFMQELQDTSGEPDFDTERLRHLKYCHGLICDLVSEMDQECGPFILLSLILLFIHLLMDRTRSLLSKMVGQSDRFSDPAQLDLFVVQARMRTDAIVPMGMFVVARPFLVTIFGAVTTYLMIVFQIQNAV